MANVLAVFAHPDDEVLGCGGTLAKHWENGDSVFSLFAGEWRGLGEEAIAANRALLDGSCAVGTLNFPDQKFDTVPLADIANRLHEHVSEYVIERFDDETLEDWPELRDHGDRNPDIIYTHHPDELNLDHALTSRAVLTAFRPKPDEKPRRIMACEVLSSTEWTFPQVFQPDWFEELNQWQLNKKHEAMLCYQSEVEKSPHPRSNDGIRNLALYRGQQSGVQWAEAFQLLRAGPF